VNKLFQPELQLMELGWKLDSYKKSCKYTHHIRLVKNGLRKKKNISKQKFDMCKEVDKV